MPVKGGCGGRWLWLEVVVVGGDCSGRWLWWKVVVMVTSVNPM